MGEACAADVSACQQTNQFLVCNQTPTEEYLELTTNPAGSEEVRYTTNCESSISTVSLQQVAASGDSDPGDNDSWEQFAKDPQHTCFTTADGPDTNSLSWKSNITAIGAPSTVVANGVLYAYRGHTGFDSGAAALEALDEETGDELWNTSIPATQWGSWSSPAYHNGSVFTSTGTETWRINATDGEVIWKFVNPSGHASCNGGPTIADGLVFCSDWDGNHYYCLYEGNGTLKWTFGVTGYAQGTPAYDDGKVYLTSWVSGASKQGHVYCVYAENGTALWHNNNIDQNCCGSASVAGDMVYVSTYNFYGYGDLIALSKETGEIIWQKTIERTDSTPAIAYGNVYVTGGCSGYSAHRTYCFNATTGDEIWETDAADDIGGWTCTVAVADGKVYVGGETETNYFNYDRTFALDAFTGDIIWQYPQGGAAPIAHDGRVFTVGNDGKIYAFGPAPPVAPECDFDAVPTSGIVPLIVNFTDLSSGEPTEWAWDFNGDGVVDSTEQNPSYTYETPGTYSVSLTVTNSLGSDTCTQSEFITVKPKTVWYVDDDGAEYPSRDYPTIGEAISAACEGGTIKVYAGTYPENLTLTKQLTLEGIGDPEIGTVDLEAAGSIVRGVEIENVSSDFGIHVAAAGCTVENVAIKGCNGGIWLDSGSTGTSVFRSTITGCSGAAAIYDTSGGNFVYENDITGNSAGNIRADNVTNTWHSPEQATYRYGSSDTCTNYLGNHWGGYAGVDADGDGIGDTAYDGIDDYPLIASFTEYHDAVPTGSWYQFHLDGQNTGVTASPGPIEEPGQLWRAYAGSGINVPPLVAGDRVYTISTNGNVTAFNKINGEKVWESETYSGSIQEATLAYGNGKIFAATFNGYLFAFDADSGEELWQAYVTDNNLQGPVLYADHRIYVGDGNFGSSKTRYYYCYDEYGNELWKHATDDTAGFQWCGAAVAGDYIVYPTREGTLVSLNVRTGAQAGETDLTAIKSDLGHITASAVYGGGYVYVSSRGDDKGYVFKVGFDEDTGAFTGVEWSAKTAGSTSTPAVTGGRVYVGDGSDDTIGHLICLDDTTGAVVWSYETESGVKCSPAVSVQDGTPYIYFTEAANDGYLYCVDGAGTKLWWYNPHSDTGYVSRGVAVSEGCLYLGTDAGYLHCIATGPSADFTANVTEGIMPMAVQFTDLSTGNPSSWQWNFGDGTTSTEQNPVHTYTKEGDFTVQLTAINSIDSRSETKYHYISVHETGLSLTPASASIATNTTTEYTILLSSAPDGLSRYNIRVALENPDVAEIVNVTMPEWATTQKDSGVPYDSLLLWGYDGNDAVKAGAKNIELGTITVRGDMNGSTGITVGLNPIGGYLTDDAGTNFVPYTVNSSLTVTPEEDVHTLPGMDALPRDLDGDGLYEDLNANGEVDLADFSLYFVNMEWIGDNEPMSAFDYSGNGEIDLADVSLLFGKIA